MSNRKQERTKAVQDNVRVDAKPKPSLYVEKTVRRTIIKNPVAGALDKAMTELLVKKFGLSQELLDQESKVYKEVKEEKFLVPADRRRVKLFA